MYPPTYVHTHILVRKTIIEDSKLVFNQSTKYFTVVKNNHYSNLDIDTIDHGKIIDYTTHHVCQEITVGASRRCCYRWWWWTRRRGVDPTRGDFGSISPLLNSSGDSLLSLCVFVFDLHFTVIRERLGDPIIVDFTSKHREPHENGRHRTLKPQNSIGGVFCLIGLAICSSLGPGGSTLANFVHMEII
jgi:hypothetical protein